MHCLYKNSDFFFHLLVKRQFLANNHLHKKQIQYFPLYGTETGNHVSQVWGDKNYTGSYTEAKCQCLLAQAIKLTLIRKPTESLRIIHHFKALRYIHFIFLRQTKVRFYLLVVFPCIHSFMKLTGFNCLIYIQETYCFRYWYITNKSHYKYIWEAEFQ